MGTPRGLRNNNPLNVRDNGDKFVGERAVDTDPGFKQFISDAYGYRAAFCVFGTYLSRGVNTIDKIIKSWAPPQDHNNTEGYINRVAAMSGVGRFQILTALSGNEYIKIATAMCFVENGMQANMSDLMQGFMMQTKIRKL